jgi:hypothetical protein
MSAQKILTIFTEIDIFALKTQIACGGRLYKKLNGLIFEVKLKRGSVIIDGGKRHRR